MKIITAYPPNYDQLCGVFDIVNSNSIVFTYGDTIYNPHSGKISHHLLAHEKTHSLQQGKDPHGWWSKYITDDSFRLSQELEAYRNQYRYFCHHHKDRNQQFVFLHIIAKDLSGKIYGNIISRGAAIRQIKNHSI